MDRLSAMALLVKVTELGSMSAAARALNMPLTTVSRHIGELESTLGVRLLLRTTRKLTLTDAGVDYVAAARRILEEVENAERQAAGEYQEPKGELTISAPTMFGRQHVLPVVTEFLARYPQIRVRLLLSDRNADLVDDHIDLAVRIGPLPDSGMVATRLGEMRIVTCAHPALLEKHGHPQRPRELARCRSFVLNRRCPIAAGALRRHGGGPARGAAAGALRDHAGERRRCRATGGRRSAPAALPGHRWSGVR
jgi:DNA-binding transcriptional LysR family regulator